MPVLKIVIFTGKLLDFQNLPLPEYVQAGVPVRRDSQTLFPDFLTKTLGCMDIHYLKVQFD